MHHTVCIHVTCLATHCSANYPTLRGSGDNNYHQTLGADEVACMKWFSDPDSFLLCLRFALFVSFFFHIFFFHPVKLPIWMGAKWLSVPQRELRLQLPIWQPRPPPPHSMLVCRIQSTSSAIASLSLGFLTCFASLKARWNCGDTRRDFTTWQRPKRRPILS